MLSKKVINHDYHYHHHQQVGRHYNRHHQQAGKHYIIIIINRQGGIMIIINSQPGIMIIIINRQAGSWGGKGKHLPNVNSLASGGKEAPYTSIVIYPLSKDKAPAAQ